MALGATGFLPAEEPLKPPTDEWQLLLMQLMEIKEMLRKLTEERNGVLNGPT